MRNDALESSPPTEFEFSAPLPPVDLPIVLAASPGILLVWTQIWLAFGILIWTLGRALAPGYIGQAIVACILIVPAVWASWQIAVRAVASERELAATGPE